MIPLQETIDHLVELNHSPDICHACFDNALCEDCFIGSAIHYLNQFKKIVDLPEGEAEEITLTVRKKTYEEHVKEFVEKLHDEV